MQKIAHNDSFIILNYKSYDKMQNLAKKLNISAPALRYRFQYLGIDYMHFYAEKRKSKILKKQIKELKEILRNKETLYFFKSNKCDYYLAVQKYDCAKFSIKFKINHKNKIINFEKLEIKKQKRKNNITFHIDAFGQKISLNKEFKFKSNIKKNVNILFLKNNYSIDNLCKKIINGEIWKK